LIPGRSPDADLVVVWQPVASVGKAHDHLCALIDRRMSQHIVTDEGVAGDTIDIEHDVHAIAIGILYSRIARPHVDDDFSEWSALWVLRAGGHVMGITDRRPSNPPMAGRRPLKSPKPTYVPLRVGKFVFFNAYRTHWMYKASNQSVMVAASFGFAFRPTRSDVEERIRSAIL
jgi:hypothetical protein